jgi:hypothetical protein
MVGALVSLVADHLSISVIAGVAAFIGAVVVHQRVQMSWRTREPSPLPQMPAEDR